jgi:hypothetical protein
MTDQKNQPVTVETALRSILRITQDESVTEKSLRTQVLGFANAAIELIEAAHAKGSPASTTMRSDSSEPVAWLHHWSGFAPEVRTKLADDKYGLASAVPLTLVPNGEVIAWRWADGGGYNADYRYSFVDPLENWEEVEEQNASSVIGCRALYRHPTAGGYQS